MKKIYADLEYGRISLALLEVVEKEKSYKVISEKTITGFYYGKTLKKNDEHLHNSLNDAFLYLENKALEIMQDRKEDYEEALEGYNGIAAIVLKIGQDPAAPERAIKELIPGIEF